MQARSSRWFPWGLAALLAAAAPAAAMEGEDYEEPAGVSFSVQVNPFDHVYGGSFEDGTWWTGTPVFGQFFLTILSSDIEEATFGGAGMIFRIMPHWKTAPYAGAGASYNYPFHDRSDKGEAGDYWAGHGDAGVRWWFSDMARFIETFGRFTWYSEGGSHEYWTFGIGYGQKL